MSATYCAKDERFTEKLNNKNSWFFYREVIDNTGKENGIDIVMPERTYHLIAESAEDAR